METKKINIALTSFGMSGKVFHAPFLYTHPGYHLSAIVERNKNEVKGIYPDVRSVRSFEQLLSDESIEVIVVNVPDQLHPLYAILVLEAGKHVVVEKPFTQSVSVGKKLIRLARKKNRVLSVFQNRRWDGDFLTVRQVLENNQLGRLVDFESNYMRYRTYIQPDTWKEDVHQVRGITYNLGSHMIDQAICLFGMPEAVWADIDTIRDGGSIDDFYQIRLYYPQVKVLLRASYLVKEETPRYTLHGTLGSFVKYGIDPQEERLKKGDHPNDDPHWGEEPEKDWGVLNTTVNGVPIREKIETVPGNYGAYYDALYEEIRNNATPAVAPEQSLNVIRVIEAAYESSLERKVVATFTA